MSGHLLRQLVVQTRQRVIDAWLHDLRVGWGERAVHSATAVSAVIERGHISDLHSIGYDFATAGHSLDEVLAWFGVLASKSRSFRQELVGGGTVQLAGGWADGVLQDAFAQALSSFEVLRLRLRQQVQRGETLGHRLGSHMAFVVVDTDGSETCTERVAHHARAAFGTGETMAATPSGKLIILARRDQHIRERTLHVTDAIHNDTSLVDSSIRVWIEPLAMSADHADSQLLGLAC